MSLSPINSTSLSRASLKIYLTGFVLALILTGVSFGLVMSRILYTPATLAVIFTAGFVQVLVHLHYFLHLDASREERWNVWTLIYALAIITLFVWGGLWIMFNLHSRMM
jgi:cytochrome o ubiquinol oxidase subunit IV